MKKILLILIIPIISFSQNSNISQTDLETVTIYGSMIDLNNKESGKNITIINSTYLKNYSFNSIDELLKLIPSIELQSRGGFGNQSDLVLRGSTFNQTLVLLDGMRINDPLTGHFSMYIPISPFEIHQIEIIRGGGSSIHGPDAVGGVINIVTKSFDELTHNDEIIVEGKEGLNKLESTNLFLAKNLNERLYTTFAAHVIKSDGQELYDNIFSFFDNQTFSLSHKYNVNDKLNIMLRTAYAKRYFNSQYYYTRSSYDRSNELIEKRWTQTKINYKINPNSILSLNTSYQIVNDTYIFNPDFPSYKNQTELINSRINYIQKTDAYRLVTGIDLQNRSMVSVDRGNHSDYYLGSFVNYIRFVNNISINPSLRMDYNPSYKLQFCPQIDINYNQENYNIRTSLGRTIRSADFTERYYNNNYSDTLSAGRNIGNPDLEAESSINYEIGIDIKKYKNVTFKNTLFYRKSTNLIDWVLLNSESISTEVDILPNENYLFAQNISELNTLGFESEIWFSILNQKRVSMNGSLGYIKILSAEKMNNIFDTDYTLTSKYLANNSGDRFNYNVFLNWRKMKLNFNGILKIRDQDSELNINQTLSESYFTHNMKVNIKLDNTISYSIELMNIFNTEYADILGAIMPKRWLIVGVRFNLDSN